MIVYIEKWHDFKPHITDDFFKNWSAERVTLHGVTMELIEEFIAKISGLPMEGLKFKKETNISNVVFKRFPKNEKEEKKLVKDGDFCDLDQIKVIRQDVLSSVHEYFILDGRSKRVYKFYFVF